ncbi:ribokinase [Actinopolymorpha alba]|uniref:ribokinase n=1 Tax=Actinopolymorpha alba TaxID=533267 RepID=UPI00035FC288|nr:ribokinase [Actinopolymorpha alba]
MSGRPRILVVGSYGVGLTWRMRCAPGPGETVLAEDFSREHGGKGSNQAVAARRLGADVHLVTAVGDDDFGRSAQEMWRAEGVKVTLLPAPGRPTMTGAILVESNGENRIAITPGALEALGADSFDGLAAAFVDVDICVLQMEIPPAAVLAALRLARRHGVPTILAPAPAPPPDVVPQLGGLVDHLLPNEYEAARLCAALAPGSPPGEGAGLASCLSEAFGCTAVVTVGGDGAWVSAAGSPTHVPGLDVPVVDTTGAGDTFTAAYAVALAEGKGPSAAATFGCVAAAWAVQHHGVLDGLPTRKDVLTLEQMRTA